MLGEEPKGKSLLMRDGRLAFMYVSRFRTTAGEQLELELVVLILKQWKNVK